MAMKQSDIDRFWRKVDKTSNPNGCWVWLAGKHPFGYGRYCGKLTHRISFELHHRTLKRGECVLHQCDNPKCVNPSHLSAGSRTDNARERTERGRTLCGSNVTISKLTEQQILEIRSSKQSVKQLSSIYGVSLSTIYNIINGTSWKHI